MLDEQLRRALDRRRDLDRLRRLRRYEIDHSGGLIAAKAAMADSWETKSDTMTEAPLVDFSSNDYMGLARSSQLRTAFMAKMDDAAAANSPLGSTGSRLLDGNTREHEALEMRLAQHFSSPAALLFNSGFDANASLLAVLPQPGDVIVYDELVHASMHDGMRASRIPPHCRLSFHHNDVQSLKTRIREGLEAQSGSAISSSPNVFVAVESIYSMDGDACPLEAVSAAIDELVPRNRRCLIVDEAHAVGLYGRRGAGLVQESGLCDSVNIRLVTFGKACGGSGAAVLCSDLIKQYLVNYARPLVYSTALPTVAVRLIDAALDVLSSEEGDKRAERTFALTENLLAMLQSQDCSFGLTNMQGQRTRPAPIIPLRTSRPRELAAHCIAHGYLVRPIVYPTVPLGSDRVRICVHGSNTLEEIRGLARCIAQWLTANAAQNPVRSLATSSASWNSTAATAPSALFTKAKI